jgi:hypothetical protein
MKYFENLPKKSFTSTIGTFEISDFFTYIDSDSISLPSDTVNIDSKTTLLEAAYNIYQDANSFWTFMLANKKINPFDLLQPNTIIFKQNNEEKINFLLYFDQAGNSGIAFPQGSVIVPYTENSGYSAEWSSVGNFDLYGPLAVIESTSFYDGNMVIKGQKGSTGDFVSPDGPTGDRLCVIYPSATGYQIQKSVYTGIKKKYLSKINQIKKPEDGKLIFKDKFSSFVTVDEKQPISVPVEPTQTKEISVIETIENKSKNIFAYPPNELGTLQASFITVKYN